MNSRERGTQLRDETMLLSLVQKRTGKFIKSTEATIMFTGDGADWTRSWV